MPSILRVLAEEFAVVRMNPNADVPSSILETPLYSITRSSEELSILCQASVAPEDVPISLGWKLFKFEGSMEAELTGIIAAVVAPLAERKISTIALTTFEAGYFGVQARNLEEARTVLADAGHTLN